MGRRKELGNDIVDELQKAFTLETAKLPAFIKKDSVRLEWFLGRHEDIVEAYISRRKNDLTSKRTLWDSVSEWLSLNDKIDVNVSEAKSCLELVRESAFPSYTADLDEKFESVWEVLPLYVRKDKSRTRVLWFFESFAEHKPCLRDALATSPAETKTTAFVEAVGQWLDDPFAFAKLIKQGLVHVDSAQLDGLDNSLVADKLDRLFNEFSAKLPPYVNKSQTDLKLNWIEAEHQSIFASLRSKRSVPTEITSPDRTAGSSCNTSQLVSPRKKAKITHYDSRVAKIEDVYAEDLSGANALTITGFVVDMDDTVRSVDTWDQQNKVNVKKHVLNCTLVDETGAAARIDFWED